jgi:hypothetical protein
MLSGCHVEEFGSGWKENEETDYEICCIGKRKKFGKTTSY